MVWKLVLLAALPLCWHPVAPSLEDQIQPDGVQEVPQEEQHAVALPEERSNDSGDNPQQICEKCRTLLFSLRDVVCKSPDKCDEKCKQECKKGYSNAEACLRRCVDRESPKTCSICEELSLAMSSCFHVCGLKHGVVMPCIDECIKIKRLGAKCTKERCVKPGTCHDCRVRYQFLSSFCPANCGEKCSSECKIGPSKALACLKGCVTQGPQTCSSCNEFTTVKNLCLPACGFESPSPKPCLSECFEMQTLESTCIDERCKNPHSTCRDCIVDYERTNSLCPPMCNAVCTNECRTKHATAIACLRGCLKNGNPTTCDDCKQVEAGTKMCLDRCSLEQFREQFVCYAMCLSLLHLEVGCKDKFTGCHN